MAKFFKGFDKDMRCRGFQFEEGKEYRESKADLCHSGFHACENPLDTFSYYKPGDGSRYFEVELGDLDEHTSGDDTKRCGKYIKIGAELSVAGICKAHFDYVTARCNPAASNAAGDKESASAGYRGSASAGNWGSASAGEQGLACVRGGKVKGGLGCAICCAELDDEGNNIAVVAAIVDGETIKPDTWYTVKGRKFVEVKE